MGGEENHIYKALGWPDEHEPQLKANSTLLPNETLSQQHMTHTHT